MSTADQTLSALLHGEALLAAQDETFRPLLDRLSDPEVTPEVRAEVAGVLAREALRTGTVDHVAAGRLFLAAGLVLTAGVVDGDRLAETVHEQQSTPHPGG